MAFRSKGSSSNPPFQSENIMVGPSRWLMAMGVAMIILGAFSFVVAMATTLVSVVFLGGLLLLAGVFQFAFAITSGRWSGFGLHLLLAILYGISGLFLILNPLMGAATLTLFLAFIFVTSGLFRILTSISIRYPSWGWVMIGGIVTILLGVYIVLNLPQVSLFLLGTLLGIDLIFFGAHLVAFGVGLRRESTRRPSQFHPVYT